MFTTLYATGDMFANVLGNYLYLNLGFAWTSGIVGAVDLMIGLFYIGFCFG